MTKRAAIDVQVAASASASADDFLRLSLQQASMSATNKEISKPSRTRTSSFRGVTKHRWSSKYEAHLWDNSWVNESGRKGKQVYLGGYDTEEKAAIAYDLAALKYWGRSPTLFINFPERDYTKELKEMETMSRREYIAHLKRNSSGFSRGVSKYRGVTRHHCDGRWQARIGKEKGSKDVYLGTFSSQEEAAEAYDIASIKLKGVNVVTNFDISCYDVEKILKAKLPFQEPKQTKKQQVVESAGLDSSYATTPYGFLMQDLVQGQAVAHAGGYPQVMLQPQVQAPSQSRVYGYPQSILAFGYPYPVFFYPTATAADSASH